MGCCQSSTRSQDSSSRHGESSSHSRQVTSARSNVAITTTPPTLITNDSSPSPRRGGRRGQRGQQQNGGENLSQPLRKHVWTSRRPYTRQELDREREEFFDTRVTGRSETWHAIRMSIETMGEGDLVTAQTILDAAGVVLPTGDLANGAYDEVGNFYQIPEYCVSDPVNLATTTTTKKDDDDEVVEDNSYLSEADSQTSSQRRRRREEKGKGKPPDPTTKITVKARLSDRGGPDLRIEMSRHQPVRVLVRRIEEEVGLDPIIVTTTATTISGERKGKENNNEPPRRNRVRIAYLGKILKEHESLLAQGWKEGDVVNALVFA